MNSLLMFAQNNQNQAGFYALGGIGVFLIIIGFLLWLLPIYIAIKRGHPNAAAIIALDILLGWTFLGWVASLVWSLTAIEQRLTITPVHNTSAKTSASAATYFQDCDAVITSSCVILNSQSYMLHALLCASYRINHRLKFLPLLFAIAGSLVLLSFLTASDSLLLLGLITCASAIALLLYTRWSVRSYSTVVTASSFSTI